MNNIQKFKIQQQKNIQIQMERKIEEPRSSRLNFSELKINRLAQDEDPESSDIDEQTERYLQHLQRSSARLSKRTSAQHRSAQELQEKYAAAVTPGRTSEYLISKISSCGHDSNLKYDNINQISHTELPLHVFKDTQELDQKFLVNSEQDGILLWSTQDQKAPECFASDQQKQFGHQQLIRKDQPTLYKTQSDQRKEDAAASVRSRQQTQLRSDEPLQSSSRQTGQFSSARSGQQILVVEQSQPQNIETVNDVENTYYKSNHVMFSETRSGMLSDMSDTDEKRDQNRDLMDTGVLMEQSLQLNLDPGRCGAPANISAINPMDISENQSCAMRRPSTIQEVDEPYMEETEAGNQSSFLLHKHSLGNPDPNFLMQYYQQSKIGSITSLNESGPMTPQLANSNVHQTLSQNVTIYGEQVPMILMNDEQQNESQHDNQVAFHDIHTQQLQEENQEMQYHLTESQKSSLQPLSKRIEEAYIETSLSNQHSRVPSNLSSIDHNQPETNKLMVICIIKNSKSTEDFIKKANLGRSRSFSGLQVLNMQNDLKSNLFDKRRNSQNNLKKIVDGAGSRNMSRNLDKFGKKDFIQHNSISERSIVDEAPIEPYFTTSREISQVILKQPQVPLPKDLVNSLLRRSSDIEFLLGAAHSHNPSQKLRLYSFDMCLDEQTHTSEQINQAHEDLLNNFLKTIDPRNLFNDFIFLFGSSSSELNLKNSSSIFRKYFMMYQRNEPILFLKIVLHIKNNALVIVQKNIDCQINVQSEINAALADVRRIKKTFQNPDINNCGHLVVQFNNHFVVQMADIKGLTKTEAVQTLTNDFGSMTNALLKLSPFYRGHQFHVNTEQEASSFNNFLQSSIHSRSKILLCSMAENHRSSEVAIDFTHKIKQYYRGQTDLCQIETILSGCGHFMQAREQFQQVAAIINELDGMINHQGEELRKTKRKMLKGNSSKATIEKLKAAQTDRWHSLIGYVEFVKRMFHEKFIGFPQINGTIVLVEAKIHKLTQATEIIDQQINSFKSQKAKKSMQSSNMLAKNISHDFSTFGEKQGSKRATQRSRRLLEQHVESNGYLSNRSKAIFSQSQYGSTAQIILPEPGETARNDMNFGQMEGESMQLQTMEPLRKKRSKPQIAKIFHSMSTDQQAKALRPISKKQRNAVAHRQTESSKARMKGSGSLPKIAPGRARKASLSRNKITMLRSKSTSLLPENQNQKSISININKKPSKKTNINSWLCRTHNHTPNRSNINLDSQQMFHQIPHLQTPNQTLKRSDDNLLDTNSYMTKLDIDYSDQNMRTQSNTVQYDIQTLKNRSFTRSDEPYFKQNAKLMEKAKRIGQNQLLKNHSKMGLQRSAKSSLVDFLELERNTYMQKNINEIENSQMKQESPKVRFKSNIHSERRQIKAQKVAAQALKIRELQDEKQRWQAKAKKYKALAKKHENDAKELRETRRMELILHKDTQIQHFERQIADLDKKYQNLKIENTMLKAQNCKKQTETNGSELQFLKNSIQILQIENKVKEESNKKVQNQCLEQSKLIKLLKERQFQDQPGRIERIGDLKEKQQELNDMLKSKNSQLLKMKSRLTGLEMQLKSQDNEEVPTPSYKLEQKFQLLKERYLEKELQLEEKDKHIQMLKNRLERFQGSKVGSVVSNENVLTTISASNFSTVNTQEKSGSKLYEHLKIKQSIQRKNEVLKDIKSLLRNIKSESPKGFDLSEASETI